MTEALGLAEAPDPGVTAVLLASELVTNAWRHACGALEMRLHWNGRALTIEVDNASHESPVIVRDELRGATGGFGLGLVEQLAEDWGVDYQLFGKTVHARVACVFQEPAACDCIA
jgi:two-component sensor histidine kinase